MSVIEPHNADAPQPTEDTRPSQDKGSSSKNNNTNNNITITLLPDPSSIYPSALTAWKSLFGAKASKPHPDHATFKTTYSHPNGRLLLASPPTIPIAGIIAYRKYDGRFTFPELTTRLE